MPDYHFSSLNLHQVNTMHCAGGLGVCGSEDRKSSDLWQLLFFHVSQCLCGGSGEARQVITIA